MRALSTVKIVVFTLPEKLKTIKEVVFCVKGGRVKKIGKN